MGAQTLRCPGCVKYLERVPEWIEGAKPLVAENPALGLIIAIDESLREFDKAKLKPLVERSLVRAPFDLESVFFCGWSYVWMGDPLPALDCFATFRNLGRLSPYWNVGLAGAANASIQAGRFEQALEIAEQGIPRAPDFTARHNTHASALAHLGRMEEAAAAVQEILRIEPGACITNKRAVSNYGGTPEGERYLEGLRLAGLPE